MKTSNEVIKQLEQAQLELINLDAKLKIESSVIIGVGVVLLSILTLL